MKTSERCEAAAEKFFQFICPGHEWETTNPVKWLVLSAFHLYEEEYSCTTTTFDIRDWKWPFVVVTEVEGFDGRRPWSVLLGQAVRLAKAQRTPALPSPGTHIDGGGREINILVTASAIVGLVFEDECFPSESRLRHILVDNFLAHPAIEPHELERTIEFEVVSMKDNRPKQV